MLKNEKQIKDTGLSGTQLCIYWTDEWV